MPRIQLRIYVEPGQVDVFCQLKFKDGTYKRLTGIVDTGAAVSLFPNRFLTDVEYEPTEANRITIDQAGIAGQSFLLFNRHDYS